MNPPINRYFCMPNKWTFKLSYVHELLKKYIINDENNWVDPFAGFNSPAYYSNDINPECKTMYNLDATSFLHEINSRTFDGCIFDPPYSDHQLYKSYNNRGSLSELSLIKTLILDLVKENGYFISFGWNSNGIINNLKIVEILILNHGGCHNDTIVIVQQNIEDNNIHNYTYGNISRYTINYRIDYNNTFQIPIVDMIIRKYIGDGIGCIDPFSGNNSIAQYTNDIDPTTLAQSHTRAIEYIETFEDNFFTSILFDPPYNPTILKSYYTTLNIPFLPKETTYNFIWKNKRALSKKIKSKGFAISFGYNTTGFGNKLGFDKVEFIILNDKSSNDLFIVVEQKR